MTTPDTITIVDKAAFPAKVAAVRAAAAQLVTASKALRQLEATAAKEAGSFTKDGSPAPIYDPLLSGLRGWLDAVEPAAAAIAVSAENCIGTAEKKFIGITTTDAEGAAAIATT